MTKQAKPGFWRKDRGTLLPLDLVIVTAIVLERISRHHILSMWVPITIVAAVFIGTFVLLQYFPRLATPLRVIYLVTLLYTGFAVN